MKILVIGSGGREHALVWKIRQSPLVKELFCAPGNAGTAQLATPVALRTDDLPGLLAFAKDHRIDLTVVGPEQPLTDGIVDLFASEGLAVFGPTKAAARLEGSKAFAKTFMRTHTIPTAEFRVFTEAERYDAERYIHEIPAPLVLKADGLAAGKGVTVCETKEMALEVLTTMMETKLFGEGGRSVVIEECLVGEEASIFAITDGTEFVTLAPAQDHKRIFDNDLGRNTGGMGAYAPAPVVTDALLERVRREIIRPTLRGMAAEGHPYRGCLYVGIMITETGPKVIEYNCRFGDPETQVILPLLDADIVPLLLDAAIGTMHRKFPLKPYAAVCVVIAAGGYPDRYETGHQILGLKEAEGEDNVMVFHGGTKEQHGAVVTAGGRVLGVTALGSRDDLEGTVDAAYRAVEKITFDGMYYRSDIGKKGILRAKQSTRTENT